MESRHLDMCEMFVMQREWAHEQKKMYHQQFQKLGKV